MEINSTKVQIEEFKQSILWADIVRELEFWKKGFEVEQLGIVEEAAESNPTTTSFLLHLGDINGRRKAVDYLLTLLDVFIEVLSEKEKENLDDNHQPE